MKKTYILACIFIVIDYISKLLVINLLTINKNITLINKFIYFTYVRNTGAAFSIFTNYTYILTFISIFVILLLLYYVSKKNNISQIEALSYGLLLGGATGNLIDRLVYGYVIDFIDIRLFNYNFPIFNLADTFIVIGFIILVLLELKKEFLAKKIKK